MSAASEAAVRDNRAARRYELTVDGMVAFAAYEPSAGAIRFTHTIVPEALGGKGVGSRLIKAALDDVRAQGLKVVPQCSFVAGYIDRHPDYQDLLARDAPG